MAGQIASHALERVSFVKKIPMLKKYTSDDDNPTPGYIYQEINSITFETISSCNSLLDFLISRLKKQSPCIKYKVLKILCYLARNGHSEFRSGLRHKAGVIREAESFTGPIDYLKGDALNQRVRTTASELIGLLFNVESSGMASVHSMMGPTGKKMEGFGNSPHPPAKTKTWLDSVATFAELLPDAANILKPKNNTENLPTSCRPDIAFVNYTDSANAASDFRKFLDGDDSVQSRVSEGEESENVLSMEVHLVDEITCEGGIRNVPSKEALNQFTKRCSSLNIVKVLEALNQRVLEPITEVQLKSLHVLEHLLKSDLPDVVFKMSHYCTNLHEISRTESCTVASKARKVLLLIKATVEKEKILQDYAAAQSEKSRISNGGALLDLENIDRGFGSQRAEADDSTTLFSGMSVHMQEQSSTSLKQSPVTAQGVQVSSEVLGALQGLSIVSENNISRNNNTSTTSDRNPESDIDELFGLTQTIRSTSSDVKGQELANDRVTDLFDPLCNTGAKSSDSLISAAVKPEDVSATRPACSTFTGSIPGPINSSSGSFTFCDDLSRNTYAEPRVTLPENVLLRTGSQNIPLQSIQPSFLSGISRVRSRHPPPSQGTAFSFVGKSRGSDAFSFVQDEIRARKN